MSTSKVHLVLNKELVQRTRGRAAYDAKKSDGQVVEDALTVLLGLEALEEARTRGRLPPEEADQLAVDEVKALRRDRTQAA